MCAGSTLKICEESRGLDLGLALSGETEPLSLTTAGRACLLLCNLGDMETSVLVLRRRALFLASGSRDTKAKHESVE